MQNLSKHALAYLLVVGVALHSKLFKYLQIALFKKSYIAILLFLFQFALYFWRNSMKKKTFITILHALILFLTLTGNTNGSNYLSIHSSANTPKEESGRCIIVAQQNTDSILRQQVRAISKPCTLGRIEISWLIKPGTAHQATITHLEVDAELRGRGIGQQLFQAAIIFLRRYLDSPEIAWKAQPLDRNMPLAGLIRFYEKQGGYVTKLYEAHGIACMSLRPDALTDLDCDPENSTLPENLCLFSFRNSRPDCQLKVKDFNIVKKSSNDLAQKTTIITPAGTTESTQSTGRKTPSPTSIAGLIKAYPKSEEKAQFLVIGQAALS